MTAQSTLDTLGTMLLSGGVRVVDLAGPLGPETPLLKLPEGFGDNTPPIEVHKISEYDEHGPYWAWNWLKIGEHSGTHFDAPHHWISGKDYADGYTDTIDPQNFVGPVNVIDCSKESAADPDFLLEVDHIKAWEAEHGEIGAGEWVVMRTDWYKRNGSEADFLNNDADGQPHSPGPSVAAVEYLIGKKIKGWGSECIGTDWGQAATLEPAFPAHTMLHANNMYGLASLAQLDQLPAKGAVLIAAPLKLVQGTGSPIRALALVAG